MTTRNSNVIAGIFLIAFLSASSVHAQQPPATTDDLRKEIQALSESVKSMHKDLQDIKAMLQSRAPAPPPENVLLDLGNRPVRGDSGAKLILIEFSDYQ